MSINATKHTSETKPSRRPHRRTRSETEVWKPLGGILCVHQAPGGPVWILRESITVYPARNDPRCWRAVWYEPDGTRRAARATDEASLAKKLIPVLGHLRLDDDNGERTGAELVAWYLSPDRLPVDRAWSRSYRSTQQRLLRTYVLPVIESMSCSRIRTSDLQDCVNLATTPGQGRRVAACVHALVRAALSASYLTNPLLAGPLHWQALGRPYDISRTSTTHSINDAQVLPANRDPRPRSHRRTR